MSRVQRVREYGNPASKANWDGRTCDKSYLKRWSDWASDNSKTAQRARGGEMRLPDTESDVTLHDTAAKPRTYAEVDKRMKGKDDANTDGGSTFMPGVRRTV